jgi:hypothetical protein
MITDSLLSLSSAQVVTASAATTNTLDLGTKRDIGEGKQLQMLFTVDVTAAATGGASNVTFQVIASDNADLSSPVVLAATAAIPKGTLVAGYEIALPIPAQLGSLGHRYLGGYYAVDTNNLTSGKFDCTIVEALEDGKKSYASGFSVL